MLQWYCTILFLYIRRFNSPAASFQQFLNCENHSALPKIHIQIIIEYRNTTKYKICYNLIKAPFVITNHVYGQLPYSAATEP